MSDDDTKAPEVGARWFDGIRNADIREFIERHYNDVPYDDIAALINAVYALQFDARDDNARQISKTVGRLRVVVHVPEDADADDAATLRRIVDACDAKAVIAIGPALTMARDMSGDPPASDPAEGAAERLRAIQQSIRDGTAELVMMGTPPALDGRAHDFTVTSTRLHNRFGIDWQTVSAGFGQLYFALTESNRVRIDSERMDREFIKAALAKMVDDAELDE